MAIPSNEDPEKIANEPPLEFLFDQALRGDNEALEHFFTLLETNRKMLVGRLKGLGTGAHTDTVEEIYQNTVIELMTSLEAGTVPNLEEEDRKDILKYFQRRCDGRLRDYVRPRLSPALARHKPQIPEKFADPKAIIPGEQRDTEHLALLDDAARRLNPENAEILKMFRQGMSYKEMARVTGKKEETLRNAVVRIREQLQQDIIPRSQTAELHYRRERGKAPKVLPSWEQINEAIARLPRELEEAVRFVALEQGSIEDLARRLDGGSKTEAMARLFLAYQHLSEEFEVEFPDTFRLMGPRPKTRKLSRKAIVAEVDKLPPINKDAFLFVHVEGQSVEDLAARLGDDDTHRAQARLEDAYRLLNQRLNAIFPDAYDRAQEQ